MPDEGTGPGSNSADPAGESTDEAVGFELVQLSHGRFHGCRIGSGIGNVKPLDLSGQHEAAVRFFEKYQDRILYGTDIGGRQVIREEPALLNMEESHARSDLVRNFLETGGEYLLTDDGAYFTGRGDARLTGLGLPEKVLEKIYCRNYENFLG